MDFVRLNHHPSYWGKLIKNVPKHQPDTEQLTMMTMISHEFADHEFRMNYMIFSNKHMAMGQTRYPKNGLMYPTAIFNHFKTIFLGKTTTDDLSSWESKVESPNQLLQDDKKTGHIYIYIHIYMFS